MKHCQLCKKELFKETYKLRVKEHDTYTKEITYHLCSGRCREVMQEYIAQLMYRTPEECIVCQEQSYFLCPLWFMPVTLHFCSVSCLRYIENVINEDSDSPITALIEWYREQHTRNI